MSKKTSTLLRYRKPVIIAGVVLAVYALVGFYLVPWIVGKQIVEILDESFGIEASVEDVRANPFTFTLAVRGMQARAQGEDLFGFDEALVNFQTSSLFRRAWTFHEVRVTQPWFRAIIRKDGKLNLAEIFTPKGDVAEAAQEEQSGGLPRLLVHRFVLESGTGEFQDRTRPTPFHTEIGPINLDLLGFNTLPDRDGNLHLAASLESGARFEWEGTIDVEPIRSAGRLELVGGHNPMVWRYLQDHLQFQIHRGSSDLTLDYSASHENGVTTLAVRNGALAVRDLVLTPLGDETEVLSVPVVDMGGIEFDWPGQRLAIENIEIGRVKAHLWREKDGTINLMEMATPRGGPEFAAGGDVAAGGDGSADTDPLELIAGWDISIGRIGLRDLAADVEDRTLSDPFRSGIESLQFEIRRLDNKPGSMFDFKTSLDVTTGGTAVVEGKLGLLPSIGLDAGVSLEKLSFLPAQAFLADMLNIELRGGSLSLKGRVASNADEILKYEGSTVVEGLACHDGSNKELLLGLGRLSGEETLLELSRTRLRIASVDMEGLYGNLLIRKDFTTNVGDVLGIDLLGAEGEVAQEAGDEVPATTTPGDAGPLPLGDVVVEIGAVNIKKSSADFADLSLPLPFSAKIHGLEGTIAELASGGTSARVKAEGTVDEHGLALIEGSMDMFAPDRNADMGVAFRNVEMRNLTPYFSKFAGYEIDQGRLSLDLRYTLKDRHLQSQNNILIDQLTLGQKVESPDAIGLPIRLAVAMLKDKNGQIKLDVPVEGTLDDPQFAYGKVVWQAIKTVLSKVVTAPFRALARLAGAGDKDLEFVEFAAGRSELGPPAREQLGILAKALSERPELTLEVRGVFDEEVDGAEIRRAKLDALVEERIAAQPQNESGQPALASERQRAAYESLFLESFSAEELASLTAAQATTAQPVATDQNGATGPGDPALNLTAYLDDIRARLVAMQSVTENELLALADARSAAAAAFVTQRNEQGSDGIATDRILVEPGERLKKEGDRWVRMKLVLSAR